MDTSTTLPRTTKPGPDQARLRALMRRLADVESPEAFVLSLAIDARPQAHGERPGSRPQLTVVRDRLRAIRDRTDAHTPRRESLDADVERIEQFLDEEDLDGTDGLAIFACHAVGLWEVVRWNGPVETRVVAGPTADLFGLAQLLDDAESAVVAVVDSNSCRLFVTRRGSLDELPGPDERPEDHRRPDVGGWSQSRYQRHVDHHDKQFAQEAAAAIERLVSRERAKHLILAGDERAIPVLENELAESVRSLVEHVSRIGMRASAEEVRTDVAPILAAIERREATDLADRAIGEWLADDLGVVGLEATLAALEAGQVDQLVVDETATLDEALRAELVRQAARTDAGVEIVRDHAALGSHGGVAATLRYRTTEGVPA